MEQRNGRIDRHGQRASEVKVFHFVGSQFRSTTPSERVGDIDGDLEFLFRAALKVETIREDLGKVGPVIAQQVEEAMLGHRHRLDTSRAEQESEPVRKLFKFERKLREQIAEFRDQLYETRQTLRLSPENIRDVVLIALELAGQPPLAPVSVPGLAGPAYRVPGFKGSWSACLEGLAHPHTLKIRPIVFDPELAIGRDDVVLAHLNHRLVQMCLRLLRAEVWSSGSTRRLNRVTARVATSPVLESPAVVAYGRLVVLGGDQQRLHEEVIVAGGIIREGRFNRFNVGQTQAVLETVTDELVPAGVHRQLAGLWPTIGPGLLAALERRKEDRTNGLQKALLDRSEKEQSDVRTILTELKNAIQTELVKAQGTVQLSLFSQLETDQWERNVSALQARVTEIPAEIEAECQAIQTRYGTPAPRLFPLAVVWLVPRRLAR